MTYSCLLLRGCVRLCTGPCIEVCLFATVLRNSSTLPPSVARDFSHVLAAPFCTACPRKPFKSSLLVLYISPAPSSRSVPPHGNISSGRGAKSIERVFHMASLPAERCAHTQTHAGNRLAGNDGTRRPAPGQATFPGAQWLKSRKRLGSRYSRYLSVQYEAGASRQLALLIRTAGNQPGSLQGQI